MSKLFLTSRTTLERQPLIFTDKKMVRISIDKKELCDFTIPHVGLATRHGNIEARLDTTADLSNPDNKCWFYVLLYYPWRRKDGSADTDIIITDCETYYLGRRSLGTTKFLLNIKTKTKIDKEIRKFCEKQP